MSVNKLSIQEKVQLAKSYGTLNSELARIEKELFLSMQDYEQNYQKWDYLKMEAWIKVRDYKNAYKYSLLDAILAEDREKQRNLTEGMKSL